MAARTSTSIGVGVTVTILPVPTLGLFVTSMVFFPQRRQALTEKADLERVNKDFVSGQDRSDATVLRIKDEAAKGHKTVVRFITDERKDLMQKTVGSENATIAQVDTILKAANATSLGAAVGDRDRQIESLKGQLAASDAARNRALED